MSLHKHLAKNNYDDVNDFRLSETTGNIIFRLFFLRRGKQPVGIIKLNELSKIEKCRLVTDARRLLHIVCDNNNSALILQPDE